MTILIHDFGADGWCIEDQQSNPGTFLECLDTRSEAINRARNKWAAPRQPIKIAPPQNEVIRQGDPDFGDNPMFGNFL